MMNLKNSFKLSLLAIAIFSNHVFANAGAVANATEVAAALSSIDATSASITRNIGVTPAYDVNSDFGYNGGFNHDFNDSFNGESSRSFNHDFYRRHR